MKGPKAVLSSAIATALDDFLVVDKDSIESNLLVDAKIVLKNVKVRPRTLRRGIITGHVEYATFSWGWGDYSSLFGASTKNAPHKDDGNAEGAWVKDATLTIGGMRLKFEMFDVNSDYGSNGHDNNGQQETPLSDKIDKAAAEKADNKETFQRFGGFYKIIQDQVRMIVDSLKIRILDLELTFHLPSSMEEQLVSFKLGAKSLELSSVGRLALPGGVDAKRATSNSQQTEHQDDVVDDDDDSRRHVIKQHAIIEDVYIGICIASSINGRITDFDKQHLTNNTMTKSNNNHLDCFYHTLVGPFSYHVDVITTGGQRFRSIAKGVQMVGHSGSYLVVRAEPRHFSKLCQLVSIILAPPPQATSTNTSTTTTKEDSDKKTNTSAVIEAGDAVEALKPSTFDFHLSTLLLSIHKNSTGPTACTMNRSTADAATHEVAMSGIKFSIEMTVPSRILSLEIQSIDEFHMPGVLKLDQPIVNTRVVKEGGTLSIDVASIELTRLKVPSPPPSTSVSEQRTKEKQQDNIESKKAKPGDPARQGEKSTTTHSVNPTAPFLMGLTLKRIEVRNAEEKGWYLKDLIICFNPLTSSSSSHQKTSTTTSTTCTEIAIQVGEFHNHLLHFEEVGYFYCSLPRDQPKQLDDSCLSMSGPVHVTAGYTLHEWATTFQFHKHKKKPSPWKLPFAEVDPIDFVVSFKGQGVTVKGTEIAVKSFHGPAETTSHDLALHYASTCWSHVADFIPNAHLLGINVVDSVDPTKFWLGGMTPAKPLVGMAAMSAFDRVKSTLEAGKKSLPSGDEKNPFMDLWRNVTDAAAQEATRGGASKGEMLRGKASDALNSVVDAAASTRTWKCINNNGKRLGAATGAGGAGVLAGGLVAGPIGAVVGGVAGGVAAHTANLAGNAIEIGSSNQTSATKEESTSDSQAQNDD